MKKVPWLAVPLLALAFAPPAFSQEACSVRWEYRIVDLAEVTDKLVQRSQDRTQASSQLLTVLNRLGSDGWDLASEHSVAISEEIDEVERGVTRLWVAELRPSTALLKRQIPCR